MPSPGGGVRNGTDGKGDLCRLGIRAVDELVLQRNRLFPLREIRQLIAKISEQPVFRIAAVLGDNHGPAAHHLSGRRVRHEGIGGRALQRWSDSQGETTHRGMEGAGYRPDERLISLNETDKISFRKDESL